MCVLQNKARWRSYGAVAAKRRATRPPSARRPRCLTRHPRSPPPTALAFTRRPPWRRSTSPPTIYPQWIRPTPATRLPSGEIWFWICLQLSFAFYSNFLSIRISFMIKWGTLKLGLKLNDQESFSSSFILIWLFLKILLLIWMYISAVYIAKKWFSIAFKKGSQSELGKTWGFFNKTYLYRVGFFTSLFLKKCIFFKTHTSVLPVQSKLDNWTQFWQLLIVKATKYKL